MANWMQEFLKEFPGVTERLAGTQQRLDVVETLVIESHNSREISAQTLSILENTKEWNYPIWWPILSRDFGNPIQLPQDMNLYGNRERAIEMLYDRLHHIEVVSVVLRFVFPEFYGIISPPVSFILNLPPLKEHIPYYLNYLKILRMLGDHYDLVRVADVDMALWSAAHAQKDLPAAAQLMYQDEFFQEIRLKNAFSGLGAIQVSGAENRAKNERLIEHLLIARALVSYDHILAALICGRSFELLIDLMCTRWNISRGTNKFKESEVRQRLKKMAQHPEFMKLGYSLADLNRWRDWRNIAVHPESRISRKEAHLFVTQVSEIIKNFLQD